jgi:hypothetical protein
MKQCNTCHKRYQGSERGQAVLREYSFTPKYKHLHARNREKRYERGERYKDQARWRVKSALRSGKLKRQPCEVCGAKNSQAHHDDYSKPLEVRWLCPAHHGKEHAGFVDLCDGPYETFARRDIYDAAQ